MKSFFKLLRFLVSPVRLSVMGWDDLLMGLAMAAGQAAIKKEMAGDQFTPGQPGKLQTMDLNALLSQAQDAQQKRDEQSTGPNSLHFNKYQ